MESTPALPLPTSDEKIMAIIMHVMPLFGLVLIGPFIIWLIKRTKAPTCGPKAQTCSTSI